MSKLIDLTGQDFGYWHVIERAENRANGNVNAPLVEQLKMFVEVIYERAILPIVVVFVWKKCGKPILNMKKVKLMVSFT